VGEDRGTVVLLHGAGASADTWWQVGPLLAERGWRVLAPNLLAHGGRPAPGPSLTLDLLAEDVAARLPQRVDLLVGHSLGALVGVTLGGESGLVLEDPPGIAETPPPVFAELLEHDAAQVTHAPELLEARVLALNPRWAANDVRAVLGGLRAVDAGAVVAALRDGLRWDVAELVRADHRPLLVLAASERGSALRGGERRAVERALPAGRFRVLDGGHALHRDRPLEWVAAVTEFGSSLAGVTPRNKSS
jgi:pimeloyl-ACP methyl ester carboxylesterase